MANISISKVFEVLDGDHGIGNHGGSGRNIEAMKITQGKAPKSLYNAGFELPATRGKPMFLQIDSELSLSVQPDVATREMVVKIVATGDFKQRHMVQVATACAATGVDDGAIFIKNTGATILVRQAGQTATAEIGEMAKGAHRILEIKEELKQGPMTLNHFQREGLNRESAGIGKVIDIAKKTACHKLFQRIEKFR